MTVFGLLRQHLLCIGENTDDKMSAIRIDGKLFALGTVNRRKRQGYGKVFHLTSVAAAVYLGSFCPWFGPSKRSLLFPRRGRGRSRWVLPATALLKQPGSSSITFFQSTLWCIYDYFLAITEVRFNCCVSIVLPFHRTHRNLSNGTDCAVLGYNTAYRTSFSKLYLKLLLCQCTSSQLLKMNSTP